MRVQCYAESNHVAIFSGVSELEKTGPGPSSPSTVSARDAPTDFDSLRRSTS